MSPPEKKRKTKRTTKTLSLPNPSLPDDLLLNIIARVSRLYYPTFSLVSKRFRSLIASPELYKIRSLVGNTESCIYVCFRCHPGYRWFTLCRKPDKTLSNDTTEKKKKKKSSGYVLAIVPIPNSPKQFSNLVAVGSEIYSIARSTIYYDTPSSKVSVLDCRSHKWREAPRLKVEPLLLTTGVIDRKICVAGLHHDELSDSLQNSFEVFDSVTQIWDPEPIPFSESNGYFHTQSACVDGKFHVVTDNDVVAYDTKEGRWDNVVGREMKDYMLSSSFCAINNVLYSVTNGKFRWYDTELRRWRKLLGLVGLPKFPPVGAVVLVDYGGRMAVFWEDFEPYYKPGEDYLKLIWCAEITLERPNSYAIRGNVEWFDTVVELPNIYGFVNVVAATL